MATVLVTGANGFVGSHVLEGVDVVVHAAAWSSLWSHLCNIVRLEHSMGELAAGQTAMVSPRCGLFVGARYGLGLLPVLLPRLRTRLVPWIRDGATSMPLISGRDLGQAFVKAAMVEGLRGYEQFQIVGPEIPTVCEVIGFLRRRFGYAEPAFSVPFGVGYVFAWLMERLDPLVPWAPLVVRSIIFLLEETSPDNGRAEQRLGYRPTGDWRVVIEAQLLEMQTRQQRPMKMAVPVR